MNHVSNKNIVFMAWCVGVIKCKCEKPLKNTTYVVEEGQWITGEARDYRFIYTAESDRITDVKRMCFNKCSFKWKLEVGSFTFYIPVLRVCSDGRECSMAGMFNAQFPMFNAHLN